MWARISSRCATAVLRRVPRQNAASSATPSVLNVPMPKLRSWRLVACGICAGTLAGYCTFPRTCLAAPSPDAPVSLGAPITSRDDISNNISLKMELISVTTQAELVHELQRLETSSKKFVVDKRVDADNGGSITCVIEDGDVIEKACVNVAVSTGILPADAAERMRVSTHKDGAVPYTAVIITSTIHPRNPNVPSLQFSYSYFEARETSGVVHWWFDGGCELIPYILNEEDIRHFHKTLKQACDRHSASYYRTFKQQCDQHFFVKHRKEHRGVGGIYFEQLNNSSREKCLRFVSDCLRAVLPCYIPIVERNKDKGYSYCDRDLQLARQAQFVEFALLYDADEYTGLMLPLNARWSYKTRHREGSEGNGIFEVLRHPRDWV